MKFYKQLYLGESLQNKKAKIIWKLKTRAALFDIYVIIMPKDGTEIEYFNSSYLKQKFYKRHKPTILGIARGVDEVEDLLKQMIEDTYANTGNYDVNAYLKMAR